MAQFTVAIPVYNGARFLAQALESIAAQDLDGVEVLVSDNASSDATPAILEEWASRLPLRVVRRPETLPMREHFNALLEDVSSDAYMLLCADDYLADPDALALGRKALDEHPDVAAIYCDLLYVTEGRKRLAVRRFKRSGRFDLDAAGRASLRTGRNLFGIPLAVRRSALSDLRYAAPFHYAMDLDLSWALAARGGGYHLDRPLIANRYGAHNTTWTLLRQGIDEMFALAAKHDTVPGPARRLRMIATAHFVNFQKYVFRAIAGWRSRS